MKWGDSICFNWGLFCKRKKHLLSLSYPPIVCVGVICPIKCCFFCFLFFLIHASANNIIQLEELRSGLDVKKTAVKFRHGHHSHRLDRVQPEKRLYVLVLSFCVIQQCWSLTKTFTEQEARMQQPRDPCSPRSWAWPLEARPYSQKYCHQSGDDLFSWFF